VKRDQLRRLGRRKLRLIVPDARSEAVRNRIAAQVAGLRRESERDALDWIEVVSEIDRAARQSAFAASNIQLIIVTPAKAGVERIRH
jgi:hypothetical protein